MRTWEATVKNKFAQLVLVPVFVESKSRKKIAPLIKKICLFYKLYK